MRIRLQLHVYNYNCAYSIKTVCARTTTTTIIYAAVPLNYNCTIIYAAVPLNYNCTIIYAAVPHNYNCTIIYAAVPHNYNCTIIYAAVPHNYNCTIIYAAVPHNYNCTIIYAAVPHNYNCTIIYAAVPLSYNCTYTITTVRIQLELYIYKYCLISFFYPSTCTDKGVVGTKFSICSYLESLCRCNTMGYQAFLDSCDPGLSWSASGLDTRESHAVCTLGWQGDQHS